MIVCIGLLIGKIIFQELFDNRPFKFEKYKTNEQLDEAAKLKFPVGSDLNYIKNILEKSGAKCYTFKTNEGSKNHENIVSCTYNTSLFSLHLLERYRVSPIVDKDNKLIDLETLRTSGLMLYIP